MITSVADNQYNNNSALSIMNYALTKMDKSYFTVKAENRQFEEALCFIREVQRLHFSDGLPHKLKKVQIAGTNGKGSTAAMLSSILICAGYRTGLYTSPSLVCVNERIRINGEMIADDDLCAYIPEIAKAQENIGRQFGGFERITAASMLYYLDKNVDIAVMETGLGGRYDTVSAVDELILSCITAIGMDHMIMLGDTLDKIAWEKCGIMRRGIPTVAHMQAPLADDMIKKCAAENDSHLIRTGDVHIISAEDTDSGQRMSVEYKGEKYSFTVPLSGEYQRENAVSALACALSLRDMGFDLTKNAIEQGIGKAVWDGRLQNVRVQGCRSDFVLDGAHNPHAMKAVADYITAKYPSERFVVLFSMMADKDIDGVLHELSRFAKAAVCVSITPRSEKPEALAKKVRAHGLDAQPCESVDEGLKKADGLADGGKVFALGSLYLVGEILKRK